jgi:predicted acyltransferase
MGGIFGLKIPMPPLFLLKVNTMTKQRFQSLDVMRGLTLALMILVNTPGSWDFVYAPLLHADWHGATPTDFVFPFFLFIIGSALFFSSRSSADLSFGDRLTKVGRRSLLIFLIGVLLTAFPFTNPLGEWRILGVLQRIALAYFVAAPIALFLPLAGRALAIGILLLGYWALLMLSDTPYSLAGSVVRQVDLWVFGAEHLWQGKGLAFDPEGLLSTLPAVASVLLGFEATRLLCTASSRGRAIWQLFGAGILLVVLSLAWHPIFPINKYLWTSSFVLLTGGAAILVLLMLIALEPHKVMQPFYDACAILGKNPLLIYVLSILWAKTLRLIPVGEISAYQWLFDQLNMILSAVNASLAFALLQVGLMWAIAWYLHRKRIIVAL